MSVAPGLRAAHTKGVWGLRRIDTRSSGCWGTEWQQRRDWTVVKNNIRNSDLESETRGNQMPSAPDTAHSVSLTRSRFWGLRRIH